MVTPFLLPLSVIFRIHNASFPFETSSRIDSKGEESPLFSKRYPSTDFIQPPFFRSLPRKQPGIPRRREEQNKDTFINPTRLLLLRNSCYDTRAIRQFRNFIFATILYPPVGGILFEGKNAKRKKNFSSLFPSSPRISPRISRISRGGENSMN